MIRNFAKLEALHRRHEDERLAAMTYEEALAIYTALWIEARDLHWDGAQDWLYDLEPDLAVARAINDGPTRS
jgi:hypothetical protein